MATSRRHGNRLGFWGTINASGAPVAATVNANDISTIQNVGRNNDQMMIYIDTSGASSFQLQVAHSSGDDTQGVTVDPDNLNLSNASYWYDYNYTNNTIAGGSNGLGLFTFSGAARVAIGLPDWVGGFARLKCISGTAVSVIAGWEAWGD